MRIFRGAKSYNSNQTISQNKAARRIGWWKRDGWYFIGTLFFIVLGFWYGVLENPYFSLHKYEVNSLTYIPQEVVYEIINHNREKKIFGIISTNNFFTFNSKKLIRSLREDLYKFSALENIRVEKKFPQSLIIYIEERIPAVVWIAAEKVADPNQKTPVKFIVDRNGVVTQRIEEQEKKIEEIFNNLPQIQDENRANVEIGWTIFSAGYLSKILELEKKLNENNLFNIKYFIFPEIDCTTREYTAQTLLNEEILASATDEFKEKKREIQTKFKKGLLSLDESLDALERIKQEEISAQQESTTQSSLGALKKWQAVDVPVDCDLVKVARDITMVANFKEKEKNLKILFDTKKDFTTQLEHLQKFIFSKQDAIKNIDYVDLRFDDRLYYK